MDDFYWLYDLCQIHFLDFNITLYHRIQKYLLGDSETIRNAKQLLNSYLGAGGELGVFLLLVLFVLLGVVDMDPIPPPTILKLVNRNTYCFCCFQIYYPSKSNFLQVHNYKKLQTITYMLFYQLK